MSRIPTNLPIQQPQASASGAAEALGNVDLDQFIQLMIAELQNQDPLDPLDNNEILQQITQIREIGSNEQLTATLQAVMTGQNLATASNLIGREITALTEAAENVQGIVDRVSVETDGDRRVLKIHIGDQRIDLENIREIVGQPTQDNR